MLKLFKELVLKTYKDFNLLELTAEKLIEAKEIRIHELREIQSNYEAVNLQAIMVDEALTFSLDKKESEVWTRSEDINNKLRKGNALIEALNKLSEDVRTNPRLIATATYGAVRWDFFCNQYIVSKEFIFN